MISPSIFFTFWKFWFFWFVRRVKEQKMVQNDKKICLLCSIFQKPYVIRMLFMVNTCEIICPGFFYFFKILIFQVFRGVKVQKIVHNGKKFCPSCSMSQEIYIIWLSFLVHMMISPGGFFFFFFFFFFIFSKFWFFWLLGV